MLRILAITGGVGGAKLAMGLSKILAADEVLFAVNTADDFTHFGLHISPDIDSLTYALAEENNAELGWGRSVYFSWRVGDKRLPYLCQLGVGLSALPALVQAHRVREGKEPWLNYFMAPPELSEAEDLLDEYPPYTLDTLQRKLHRFFEFGTVYTMVAGLLNVLAIYDAWGGPVFPEKDKEEEEEKEDGDGQEGPAES